MNKLPLTLLALLAVSTAPAFGNSIIYDNTTTDTLVTYFYSSGPYTQIGDSVTLGGIDRILNSASIQFFNGGEATGTFSAALSFWNPGSPVGSQVGSSYVLNGLTINGFDILTVTFSNLNLPWSGDGLVFAVAISNVSAGLDLGLNAFEPPKVGSSNNASILVNSGSGFSTGATAAGQGNLYFALDATSVPEPSTVTMAGGALAFGLLLAHRRRRSQK